jgi:hypothetical protein
MSKKKADTKKSAKRDRKAKASMNVETLIKSADIQQPTAATATYQGTVMINRQVFVIAKVDVDGDQPLSVMAGASAGFPASATVSLTRQGGTNFWTGWVMLFSTNYYVRVEAVFMNPLTMMMQIVGKNSQQLTDPGT